MDYELRSEKSGYANGSYKYITAFAIFSYQWLSQPSCHKEDSHVFKFASKIINFSQNFINSSAPSLTKVSWMIEVGNLTKKFGDKVAVDGISFRVHDGEIYGLLGPNGSGKSTTMKILAGILKPTSGKVLVEGINVTKNPIEVKKIVGYVPETPILYESLTPSELFKFVGSIRGIPKDKLEERVNYFVKAFGIEKYLEQFIGTLSFGTQQKVSLITALLHDPKVLILDEAMNGLDPKSARILRELLLEFKNEGKSIVFSTHILSLAEIICDKIGVIYQGKIIAEGTIEELKEKAHEESLEDVFLKLTESKDEIAHIVQALRDAL